MYVCLFSKYFFSFSLSFSFTLWPVIWQISLYFIYNVYICSKGLITFITTLAGHCLRTSDSKSLQMFSLNNFARNYVVSIIGILRVDCDEFLARQWKKSFKSTLKNQKRKCHVFIHLKIGTIAEDLKTFSFLEACQNTFIDGICIISENGRGFSFCFFCFCFFVVFFLFFFWWGGSFLLFFFFVVFFVCYICLFVSEKLLAEYENI